MAPKEFTKIFTLTSTGFGVPYPGLMQGYFSRSLPRDLRANDR